MEMKRDTMEKISIKNLNFSYSEKEILKGLNLEIEKGGLFSIIGPNGAGKSTILKNIMKFYDIKQKTIYIDDKDINLIKRKELASKLAYVPQDLKRDKRISVNDFILSGRYAGLKFFEDYGKKDIEDLEDIMKLLNLSKYKEKNIMELSGGEFQRVMIARAILQGADYLIMDEPVSNLDIHYQLEIMDLLKKLSKTYFTVIIVLHDINLAAQYSDQIILMNHGEIVKKGSAEDIIKADIIQKYYKVECKIIENPINGTPYIMAYKTNKIND